MACRLGLECHVQRRVWALRANGLVSGGTLSRRGPLVALFAADSAPENVVAGGRFVNFRLSLAA
jgi:hypothetical protein